MLKETFITFLKRYSIEAQLMNDLWNEIEMSYSGKHRHYHTLEHLENLLGKLNEVKNLINDWDTILFTLYYHDIVYNPLRNDNEEKSAELMEERLMAIGLPQSMVDKCKAQILATKKHVARPDSDTNYFTDADLSILGQDWSAYSNYAKNVRKEYSVYPDLIYNPGRKKVLKHFLEMNPIFKTIHFYEKLELQAKNNLQKELGNLGYE